MEMLTHTNETIGSIKRQIIRKIKLTSNIKLELFINGDLMMDKKVLGQMAVRDKTVSCPRSADFFFFPGMREISTVLSVALEIYNRKGTRLVEIL